MARSIEIAVANGRTQELLAQLGQIEGVAGVSLFPGASRQPPGDLVRVIAATSEGVRAVLGCVRHFELHDQGLVTTLEPRSVVATHVLPKLKRESNETNWEEMAYLLRQETNVSTNYVALMFLSGALAAAGILANTIHLVIGAMVVAPGFEPLVRLPFGLIGGPRDITTRGLFSIVAGYAALALGAAAVRLIDGWMPIAQAPFETLGLVGYWSQVTWSGALVALLAGATGVFTIAAQREVLSAGVMIALALIPAAALTGMAAVGGEWPIAGQALSRLAVEMALVIGSSAVVLGAKQLFTHRRKALS